MAKISDKKKHSSIAYRASRTALLAAVHRFMASKESNPNFRGPDDLAKLFLPTLVRIILTFPFARCGLRDKLHKKVPGTYEYVTARTKYFDDLFQNALKENIPQEGVAVPALAVVGERDTLPAKRAVPYLCRVMLHAVGYMVPGVGHQWNAERPEMIRVWVDSRTVPGELVCLSGTS